MVEKQVTLRKHSWLRRISLFECLLVSVLILSHLVAALTPAEKILRWYTTDDAFYYFKVAQNISEGHGSTFDGFGNTNGYHPLWMLVCIPVFSLARIDLFLPLRVLVMVMGIFQAASGLLLYRAARKLISQPIAIGVAVLWTLAPFVHRITAQNGLESGISAFFLVLTLYLLADLKPDGPTVSTKQLIWLSLSGTLAVLSRLDNIFVILMLGTWLVFRSSPIRNYLCLDVMAIAVSVWVSFMAWVGLGLVYYQYKVSALVMIAIGIFCKVILGYFLGLYQPPLSMPILKRLVKALTAVSIGSAGTAVVMLGLVKAGMINGFPRMALLLDWGISFFGVAAIRLVIDWLARGRLPASTTASPVETLRLLGKAWLRSGGIYYGILAAVLVAYMGWNYAQFGTPTPVSGQIKEWWGSIYTIYGRPTDKPTIFFGIDPSFVYAQSTDTTPAVKQSRGGPWATAISWLMRPSQILPRALAPVLWMVYGIVGLVLLKSRVSGTTTVADQLCLLPLLAGCLFQVWTYHARGYVAIREWYWVAELVCTCLAVGVVLHGLTRLIPQPRYQKLTALAGVSVICILVMVDYGRMVNRRLFPDQVVLESESYLPVVRKMEESTEPSAVIGLTGGGDMAYFIHDRRIVNLDGLINSKEYFIALKNSRAAAYLASIHLDYVYGKGVIFTENDPYQEIFKGRLKQVTHFDDGGLYRFVYETVTK